MRLFSFPKQVASGPLLLYARFIDLSDLGEFTRNHRKRGRQPAIDGDILSVDVARFICIDTDTMRTIHIHTQRPL